MTFVYDWQRVLQRSWSIRLIVIAAILSGIEVALPFLFGVVPIPPGWFAAASGLVTVVAFIARIMAQANMGDKG